MAAFSHYDSKNESQRLHGNHTMTEHRRRLDENGVTVHERYTDTDRWARLDQWSSRYKIGWMLWLSVIGASGWLGTRVVQPINSVPAIAARQMAVIARLDAADSSRVEMKAALIILIRMQCIQLTASDRAKIPDFDCRDIPLPLLP